jgi:hypothetical protein
LMGRYLFGDFCSGRVWTTSAKAGRASLAPRTIPYSSTHVLRRRRSARALRHLAGGFSVQDRSPLTLGATKVV